MNLLYAAAWPVPSRAANAVHVMKMSQALAHAGHNVTLFSPPPDPSKPDAVITYDPFGWYGVDPVFKLIHSRTIFIKSRILHAMQGVWEARRIKADLVYSRCLLTGYACALAGFAVIFEQHAPYDSKSRMAHFFYQRLMHSKNLAALVVISDALKNIILRGKTAPEHKIFIAHDGADPLPPRPVSKQNKRPQIGYTGTISNGRGIELIVALAEKFPHTDFRVIGGDPPDVENWRTKTSGMNNMFFHGHRPPAEIKAALPGFDILLAPYQKKVMVRNEVDTSAWMSPLKIFEYMSSGKPMIASDLPVLHEVLRDGENAVLCPPDDIGAWEKAIRNLIETPDMAQTIGAAALKDFEAHYTWAARAKSILSFAMARHPRLAKRQKTS